MEKIDRLVDLIYGKIVGYIVKIIGFVMTGSVLLQVISRYILPVPFPWTEELSRLTFVWFAFLGATMTLVNNGHLGVDYLFRKCNEKTKWVFEIITWVVIIAFSLLMLYSGISIVQIVAKQKTAIFRISLAYSYLAIPAAGFLFTLYALLNLIRTCMFKWRRDNQISG